MYIPHSVGQNSALQVVEFEPIAKERLREVPKG